MASYYRIAALKQGEAIRFDGNQIHVDLDGINATIENDEQLLNACADDTYFYLSGGGTLLINGRYLLVVKREDTAKINPGRLSIFTGRADDETEWMQPKRVVRELFEELLLFDGSTPYRLRNVEFQPIIDQVQPQNKSAIPLEIMHIPLYSHQLHVSRDGKECCRIQALLHINARRDMNLMMLFTVSADMARLVAKDKESATSRMVAALDLKTNQLMPLSENAELRHWQDASALPKSEHLAALLETLKDTL